MLAPKPRLQPRVSSEMALLNNPEEKSCCDERSDCCNSSSIEALVISQAVEIAAPERFEAESSDMGGNTGMSPRRFTGSHIFRVGDRKSANLIGVDSSRVVATGSGSGPSMDFLISANDIHRVSSFDRFNLAPSDSVFVEGISYEHPFIEEGHLRTDEEQMSPITDQSAPNYRGQDVMETTLEIGDHSKSEAEKVDACCVGVVASRPKDVGIAHAISFSRNFEGSLR